ncbi:pseudouridine synthase [Deinococcus sp.]|uniref:pseudouridine synthase n=1 Tax=Deinococcus sp. TaxID=47478 RepID=UPI003C7A088B
MAERLQKFLARSGMASRRAAEDLILAGRVRVNGEVASLGMSVEENDAVHLDGERVGGHVQHVTYLLYKRRGDLTTVQDERGRPTVMGGFQNVPGLHPVGRLDRDSEGLLLLTTDGDLTLHLTHPRYGHEKVYRAWLDGGPPNDETLDALEDGIELEDGRTAPAQLHRAGLGVYVTITEGRNRQVRRMLEAVGHPVTRLVRVRVGGLWLEDLKPGEARELDERDLHDLLHPELVPQNVWARRAELTRERWG